LSGPAGLAIAAGIIADASLEATGLLALGWGATRLYRGASAAQRHAVWAAIFTVMPLSPVVAWGRGPALALDVPWLVGAWAVGFVLAVSPIVRGLVGLNRLRARASPDPTRSNVLHSDAISSPITWGVWRPVILLPAAASTWSNTQRDAALAHERAHIARRDWAVHLAVWSVCAVFWFHPLVWLARRALVREAEHAADDAVLATGVRPSDYAALLLSLARTRTPPAALGAGPSWAGDRVRAVLDVRPRCARRWPVGAVTLALAASSLPASGAWSAWTTPEAALTCQPGPLP
jgi:beta-lactamase regulating signal transducer with metallopeptidase domain